VTKDAGAWNHCSLADNYATGPNPKTFCAIAGFTSMHHFMPEHAALIPPDTILSLLMPRVVQRRDGTILSLVQAIKLYRSSEVSSECPCQYSTVPLPSLTWGEQGHIGLHFWSQHVPVSWQGGEMMHPGITLYTSLLQIVNIWQWRVMQKAEEATQDWQFLEFLSVLRFVTVVLAQVSTHSSYLCQFE
jgi:hypothetical protein